MTQTLPHDALLVLNEALAKIELREPLRALVRPCVEFVATPGGEVNLSVKIDTYDRDHRHAIRGLQSIFPLPSGQPGYWVERYGQDAHALALPLAKFLRQCLLHVLGHELDESLWLGDQRPFEPKHWGPPSVHEKGEGFK